jgi:hypothetical protein
LYDGGAPKTITLALTFTERKPIWFEQLVKFYTTKGRFEPPDKNGAYGGKYK